jgi:hypothetical protein
MKQKRKWIHLLKIWRFFKRYWKTLSWALIIYWLSTFSVDQPNTSGLFFNIPHFDKVIHFFMYFILVTLWLSEHFKIRQVCIRKRLVWIVLASIFYGSLMELVQAVFTTHRNGDAFDAIMNGTGVLIGLFLFRYLGFYRRIMMRVVTQRKISKDC